MSRPVPSLKLSRSTFFEWTDGVKIVCDTKRVINSSCLPINACVVYGDEEQITSFIQQYKTPATFYLVSDDSYINEAAQRFPNADIRKLIV